MIFPSSNDIILSPYSLANSLSCDTIITCLVLDIFFKISNIILLVFESKAPVGSSHNIILGLFNKALIITILCLSPPEHSYTFLFLNSS